MAWEHKILNFIFKHMQMIDGSFSWKAWTGESDVEINIENIGITKSGNVYLLDGGN